MSDKISTMIMEEITQGKEAKKKSLPSQGLTVENVGGFQLNSDVATSFKEKNRPLLYF